MHQYAIGIDLFEQGIDPGHQPCKQAVEGLPGDHDVEVVVRLDIEQLQHLVEHVPMLAGGADNAFNAFGLGQAVDQRCHLDTFRASTEQRQYFHGFTTPGEGWPRVLSVLMPRGRARMIVDLLKQVCQRSRKALLGGRTVVWWRVAFVPGRQKIFFEGRKSRWSREIFYPPPR